jgi:hypothetical protein
MSFEQFMAAMGGGGMGRKAFLEETRERLKEYDPGSKKLMKVAKKVLSNMERIPFQVGDLVEQESFSDYNFPVEGCPAVVLKTGKPGEFGVGEPGKPTGLKTWLLRSWISMVTLSPIPSNPTGSKRSAAFK